MDALEVQKENRPWFSVGGQAGTRSDRGQCPTSEADQRQQPKGRSAGPDCGV